MGVVIGDGGDDAGGAVGGCGDDSAACGVLFVDGHCVEGDPVDGRKGVFGADGVEALGEAMGTAADVEASGENAFGSDAAFGALLHGLPEGENADADLGLGCEGRRRAYLRG